MARLVVTRGAGAGLDRALGAECVVGRADDVDLTLEDIGASRRHCRVRAEGAGFVVEDLGSRNGTYVNGQRVQMAPLNDGDVVRIGTAEMIFRSDAPAAAIPPRATAPLITRPKVAVPPVIAQPAAAVKPATAPAAPAAPGSPATAEPPKKKYDIQPGRGRRR